MACSRLCRYAYKVSSPTNNVSSIKILLLDIQAYLIRQKLARTCRIHSRTVVYLNHISYPISLIFKFDEVDKVLRH